MTWGKIRRYLVILVGCLVCSASINLFLVPSHLLSGGIGGVGIIFYYLFGLPIGAQMLVYNLPLFFAAYKTMGREYTLDVVLGTVFFSFCVDAMSVLQVHAPVSDTMLAAVYGGVFSGIGAGVVFLIVKSFEYSAKFSHGLYPSSSTFLAIYFTLTGLHGIHVIGGMIVPCAAAQRPNSSAPVSVWMQRLWCTGIRSAGRRLCSIEANAKTSIEPTVRP